MDSTPYFSIIVPMYNVERYIKICIDSILAQTFRDFELIIVDDCSTDNSYKICTELYGDNKKVRLFRHEKNQGQGPARNFGIKNAQGEYIWFIDSDDAIIPNSLEKLYKATQPETGGVDAVHIKGWYNTTQDDDKPLDLRRITLSWEDNKNVGFLTEDIPRRLAENWATNRIVGFVCNTIYSRKFLLENKIEFPSERSYTEDQIVHLRGICLAKKYFMLREAFFIYRVRTESSSHKADVEMGIKSMPVVASHMKKILDKIPALDDKRILKEHCIIQTWEALLRDHARPLYNGVNIPPELDQAVYDALLPIFGENTTLVKYLFHGFNTMWRQANLLATQNYLLQQRDDLIKQQKILLEQMNVLLENQRRQF